MPETVTGKFQVVDSNGNSVVTVDPDVAPGGSILTASAEGDSIAVQGVSNATGRPGVQGIGPFGVVGIGSGGSQAFGVAGNTDNGAGTGVHGHTTSGVGVLGTSSGDGPAGRFEGQGFGVVGLANASEGSFGVAGNTALGAGTGVHGHTSTGVGVLGTSNGSGPAGRFANGNPPVPPNTQNIGLLAQSDQGSGLFATSDQGQAITAFSNNVGLFAQGAKFAGVFNGEVVVNGFLNVNKDEILMASSRFIFYLRRDFSGHRIFEQHFDLSDFTDITLDTILMASLTEIDSNGVPHLGAVTMKVYNVGAFPVHDPITNAINGAQVFVRGEIDNDQDVAVRLSVLVANPSFRIP